MIFSLQSLSQLVLLMFTNIPMFNYLFRIVLFLKGCHRLSGSLIISVKHFKGIVLVTLFFFFFSKITVIQQPEQFSWRM